MDSSRDGARVLGPSDGASLELLIVLDGGLEGDGVTDLAEAKVDDTTLLGVVTIDQTIDLAWGGHAWDTASLGNLLECHTLPLRVDTGGTDAAGEAIADDDVEMLHGARLGVAWLRNDDDSAVLWPGDAVLGGIEVLLAVLGVDKGHLSSWLARVVLDAMN